MVLGCVTFRIGKATYALPLPHVREVVAAETPTPLPDAPMEVRGLVSLRGRALLLVDLSRRFGAAEPLLIGPRTCVVVLEPGSAGAVGLLVDAVNEVVELPEERLEPAPPIGLGAGAAFASHVASTEQGLIIVLDPRAVLGALGREAREVSA